MSMNNFNFFLTFTKKYSTVSLVELFNVILFIVLMILGYISIFQDDTLLTIFLLTGAFFSFINIFYLRIVKNYTLSAHIISIYLVILFIFLVYSGGVSNTGPLWLFLLPSVMFSIYGLKRGLTKLLLFILLIVLMLFLPYPFLLETTYTFDFKIRIIIIFIVSALLSAIYEYSRSITINKLRKIQNNLEYYIIRDDLTGLYNRRGFNNKINDIESPKGTIILGDIDFFKKINDNYGHSVGDIVLKEVSFAIKEKVKNDDLVIRWGGEEFLIFLANTEIDTAYLIAEEIRKSIENLTILYADVDIKVTISLGLATTTEEIMLSDAITYADNAMYISKKMGRNKSTKY